MSKWRPIETAPKDGTYILAYPCFSGKSVWQVNWREGKRKSGWSHWTVLTPVQPSYWMPMPTPPDE